MAESESEWPVLTPEQDQLLSLSMSGVYGITLGSFVAIGIQIFMCFYSLIVFLETPKKLRHGRGIYIFVSFLMMVLFTISQAADGYQNYHLLYEKQNSIHWYILRKMDDHTWWRLGSSSCLWVVNWVGDGLLIYRCYIIWNDKRWICVFPGVAYLSSVAISIYTMYTVAISTPDSDRYSVEAFTAWVALSVAINSLVTALICYKLLRIRRELQRVLPDQNLQIYFGVIGILLESAVPLTVSGIIYASLMKAESYEGKVANSVFLCLWFSLNALAPQMIIFRVVTGRSWALKGPDSSFSTSDSSTDIEFRHGPAPGTNHHSGETSQDSAREFAITRSMFKLEPDESKTETKESC